MPVLGLDTSNYTTSAALFDGQAGENLGQLLEVRSGELGLRQSEALFQHVRRLPELLERLLGERPVLQAVGASTRPRAVEGSYMPCFLAGESQGRGIAAALGVPFYSHSHQQGHLAAAAWSAGRLDLLDTPFLAWHLSGGTTELLLVRPEGTSVAAEIIGGTSDLSAGQLIDRTGLLLGLPFPAGRALDGLYSQANACYEPRVKLKDLTFSLSGMENQVKALAEEGELPANIARFTLDAISNVVWRATQEAQRQYPGLPVLCSGGVASNSQLRAGLTKLCGAVFAEPRYSTDNAMGAAILTWRAAQKEGAR
ncbi:DNA-binding protein [Lawsonibacter sp. JLR.KK007]|uniref:DNA-binding protein n=1 Tax=Lawsonibacter sp. JLR.KK007 TaxID=3114293 RepID=UPI002FEF67B8